MNRNLARAAALLAGVALSVAGSLALAGTASAAETGPAVTYSATPVDPQPVVAGHEGDVLLQVNVAMAAKATTMVTSVKMVKSVKTMKIAKAHR